MRWCAPCRTAAYAGLLFLILSAAGASAAHAAAIVTTGGGSVSGIPVVGVLGNGTQSIVLAPDGRAFVCTGSAIAVVPPPYTDVSFIRGARIGGE